MNQPLGFYLYLILVAGIILVLFSFGYLNQYKLYGRKSEYYCFAGTVLLGISSLGSFFGILLKPKFNAGWIFYLLFFIIPLVIFNIGIGIRIVYYNWDRAGFKERVRLIFGIPENKKYLLKSIPAIRSVYYGIAGYTTMLILSVVFTVKNPIIIIITFLSEFILVSVPLEFLHHKNSYGTKNV